LQKKFSDQPRLLEKLATMDVETPLEEIKEKINDNDDKKLKDELFKNGRS
jgi:hypothetical protein